MFKTSVGFVDFNRIATSLERRQGIATIMLRYPGRERLLGFLQSAVVVLPYDGL